MAVVESGALVRPEWAGSKPLVEQAKRYVGLRDATKALIDAQLDPATTDDRAAALRQQLNRIYDDYLKRHGPVGARKSAFLEDDPEFPLVRALENVETIVVERAVRSGKTAGQTVARKEERFSKAEIFTKRTMFPRLAPERADTPADALAISLAYRNNADAAYIGQLLGVPADEARNQLLSLGLVFENPQSGVLETPDAYLSGFVKDKLKAARLAAADNPVYLRNVEALEKVQPEPVPFEGINFRLGSTWIPPQDVQAFIRDVLDVQADVALVEQTGTWTVRPVAGQSNSKNATTYGGEYAGHELVEEALNLRSPVVYDTWRDAQGEHRERNPAKTLAMQQKQEQLRALFVQWVRGNAPVARRLHEIYNDTFNGTVLRRYQGPSWDHYPGASSDVVLRPHQKAVVTRNLQHSTLLAHGVGTGKTYVLITTAMEMKRLGLAKKPVIVVQNATLNQVATSFKRLYPASKVLAPSERQREAKNRQRLMSQIATGDWDAVIVPQSWINMVPDDPVRVAGYVQQRLDELESALIEARREEGARSPKAADLQKAKNRLEKRLAELGDRKKDNVLTFEQLGVDALLVDEAHAYKKLEFTTKMDSVKGLDRGASQRGFGMLMKARFVQERNQGKNVIFATGTPISNTLAEAWNMMRYLRPDVLRQYRMEEFDAFAGLFGETVTQMEMTAGGTWKPVSRFARFTNGPELLAAFHTVADVILNEDVSLPGVPAIKNGKPTSVVVRQTPRVAGYIKYLRERLEKFERMSGREKREHSSEPLVVFGLAKKTSLDMRLIDPSAPDEPGSKVGVAVARVKEIYDTTRDVLGTQLVFADSFQSAPGQSKWLDEQETIPNPAFGKAEFNLYREFKRKLIAAGVPSGEVEIVADHDSDARREALFKKVNDGKVRVLLGSTEKMGVGVNVQQRLVALHHLDAPPRPMDVEQRNGRIVRQGNQNAEVEILTYGVENTLDAAMFQKLATKQKFINQVLRGELSGRNFEDAANEISMTFEEQMAAFSGDPLTVEKVALENQVRTLASLRDSHFRQVRAAEDELAGLQKRRLPELQSALVAQQRQARDFGERFAAEPVLGVGGRTLVDRDVIVDALNGLFASGLASAEAVLELNPSSQDYHHPLPSIEFNGVPVSFTAVVPTDFKTGKRKQNAPAYVLWKFPGDHPRAVTSGAGFLASLRSKVEEISKRPANTAADIERAEKNVAELTGFVQQPFERAVELQQKQARLEEVATELASKGREVAEASARVDAALELLDDGSARAREALERLQRGDAMGNVNMLGIQSALEIVRDLTVVGMDLVRRGYNSFAGWSKAMTARFGKRVGSWLKETWERIQNVQAAESLGLTPEGVGTVNRIESQADASESPSPVQPVYDGKVDGFLQRLKRTSGRLAYFGSPKLLRVKQELDLTESYQAAAVREQSDKLLKMLTDDAFDARPLEFKLPKWMNAGAWAGRLRRFKRLALPIAAHLNVTGKNPDGSFAFEDFTMRAGLMPRRQFAKGGHSVGDAVLVSNPLTGEMQELTIGSFVQTGDGREGYQLTRFMPVAQQVEIYDYFRNEYPEFFWAVDIYIDPDLRDVRYESHGVSVPVFNRFALAAKMAEQNPGFSPVDAYTPDVLVTRSLLGAVRGALGLRRGTRSPGRKYKTGRARESGEVRDLFSGFNIRSFQALQEEARRKFVSAVMAEATPIKGGMVPDGYVKLDTGIDEVWNAVKRLRGWQLPVDPVTGQRVFPETEARLQDDGGESFKAFFGEAAKLRGRQLMLPKPLVEMLARKYVAQRDHGRLYRFGAWLVRNSTQLFLAHPKTYVANVLTNDMFALEAAYRNAVSGMIKLASGGRYVGERDLRAAGNILGGLVLHRFRGLRELLRISDGTQYLRTVREVLPDQVFADATQLADVKVRYDDKPYDLLRQGEIGGAVLQAIQYGNIDVRAKQRLAYAYLKANAVTTARASGLRGADLRKAVDSYMVNPPVADRTRAVAAANFEMLNYADSPEWLNRFSRNDYGRLVLPFPRFGYHFLAKQAERLSALKLFLGKVPSGQRAEALADLVTVATFGLGGGGLALHALVRALFGGGEDDDEPREMFGVSSVKYVDEDGTVKTRALDRELVTSNRINLSYVFRSLGIESEDDTDFWLRVRQYPAVVMAGAAVLAESDGRKFGVEHGVATYLQSVSDLGSDFFSLGMALKVPDKVLATLRSLETGKAEKPFLDPYATRVPLSAYLTEQAMDSFVPGSRQADEILYWLDPVARRKTESKELDFRPGAWHALRTSHWTGVMDRLLTWMGNDETDLPAAGRIETSPLTLKATASPQERLRQIDANTALAEGGPNARLFLPPPVRGRPATPRVAFIPEGSREPIPDLTRISSLLGLNLRPVPREDYREAVSGRSN